MATTLATTCFQLDERITPAPAPSASPPDDAAFRTRLPATVFGDPTSVQAAAGPWALAGYWAATASGFLSCTGKAPNDLWMGWVTSDQTWGYEVLAFQVAGVAGDDLERIWMDDFFSILVARTPHAALTVTPAEYAGRHFRKVSAGESEGYSVAYTAGATFYWITQYCCVDVTGSGPTPPPAEEIYNAWLEALPLQ